MSWSAIRPTIAICWLVMVLATACGSNGAAESSDNQLQVRGHVIEVIPRSITEVETLRIRDDEGRELTFTTEGFAGFTPSHLNEHQLFGQPVLVFYLEKGGQLVAVNITD